MVMVAYLIQPTPMSLQHIYSTLEKSEKDLIVSRNSSCILLNAKPFSHLNVMLMCCVLILCL